jgi:D-3-phosphoglycerate dehydrogenase
MTKVLIADKMDKCAAEVFQNNGIEVDIRPGLTPEELAGIAKEYDGIAVRSSTKIKADIISVAGKRLKVIGRAGIGVDTIDVPAATEAGIVVMNTPFGNSITTAEHAIAMMFALARQIPQANESTHAGKWEKTKFMGVELYGKTLGVIGCGNIGAIVANRALGLQMKVIAYDPFLTADRARELGVEKAETPDDIYLRADFITIHTPMTESTRGMINAAAMAKMKKGVRLINCARGGLIVEKDLRAALESGHIAGAAMDVFEEEPATSNVLFGHPNVICTPHLGASTSEAQVNVAIQVAEQMSDFLLNGAVANAVNMPSISAEDAPRLRPYLKLAEQLGSFTGQITMHAITKIEIEYQGDVATLNVKPLSAMVLASLFRPVMDGVNMVNAPQVAKSRGITVSETRTEHCDDLHTGMIVTITCADGPRNIRGTLFAGREPRIVDIEGVPVEAALSPNMLFIRNDDTPGLIGAVGTLLGNAKVNIADFRLGRIPGKPVAVALIAVDGDVPAEVFAEIAALPQVQQAKALSFV